MTISLGMVTFDTADVSALSHWWAEAFGGEVYHEEQYFAVVRVPGLGVDLGFQLVETPTPGKNRVHLDLGSDDAVSTVAALVARGAAHVADQQMENGMAWTVLADPDGNQFCIADATQH